MKTKHQQKFSIFTLVYFKVCFEQLSCKKETLFLRIFIINIIGQMLSNSNSVEKNVFALNALQILLDNFFANLEAKGCAGPMDPETLKEFIEYQKRCGITHLC